MHRKCESRRRERINQYYDALFCLLKETALIKAKKGTKIDRCSLIRYTNAYMRELNRSVNTTARLLCRLVTTHKDLACLFSPAHLQFILQSEFVDDDVCLLLASSFNQSYVSKSPRFSSVVH
ncbi:hypothetical protein WA577_001374 [Blastocystis sp. JDR]